MNRKLITAAAAAAMFGGLLLAPNAFAEDHAAEGNCSEIEGTGEALDGTAGLYGEEPGEGQGCIVAEGEGGVPVNPLDDGHIGAYEGEDGTPALYGDCSPREDGAGFTPWDPTAGDTDTSACEPSVNG